MLDRTLLITHYSAFLDDDNSKTTAQKLTIDDIVSLLLTLSHAPLAWLQVTRPENLPWQPFPQDTPIATPLYYASYFGFRQITERLLDMQQDINTEGGYYGMPLQAASSQGWMDMVCLLIECGADINAIPSSNNGDTALHNAVSRQDTRLVELLIIRGSEVDIQNLKGFAPLCLAAEIGACEVMSVLLHRGANVEGPVGCHTTPLCLAAKIGACEVMSVLLHRGASVEGLVGCRTTPLHSAAGGGQPSAVTLLLDWGRSSGALSTPFEIELRFRYMS